MRKTLLLNHSFEVLSFVNERKAIKFIAKNKVEIISIWKDEIITWGSGQINHPSILRLNTHIRRNYSSCNFSRKVLVKRDDHTCQYCAKKLVPSQLTVDHIIPRFLGGITSFTNCVVSCKDCNTKKGSKTLEQCGMSLLRKPTHPSFSSNHASLEENNMEYWHCDWDAYLTNS